MGARAMIDSRTSINIVTHLRVPGAMGDPWPVLAAGLGAIAVAAALASGHVVLAAVAAAIPLAAVTAAGGLSRLSQFPVQERMVGIVCVLLVSSTFVWRTRTTQALETNPLDSAGLLRVALVATAGLLAFVFLLSADFVPRRIPTPLRFLGAYVVVAALSALSSPLPLQALYRALELGAGFLAVLVALVLLGDRAGSIIVRLLMIAVGVIVSLVWVEAFLFPTRAWVPSVSVVPYELQGFLPSFSSNSVGTFGALLAIWGLARPLTGRRGILLADLTLVLGLVTLLATQYRTGIVGFLIAGGVVAWHRRRRLFVAMSVATVFVVMFVGLNEIRAQTQTAFAKGRPELVGNLNSRVVYWRAAEPVIRERPILGWGLNVASRRVLVSLGQDRTSTIHGTWIEALLGTGILGAGLLAAALLTGLRYAWRARRQPAGIAIVGMIGFLLVRSITGSTVEIFDISFLIFAALALAASQLSEVSHPRHATADPLLVSMPRGRTRR